MAAPRSPVETKVRLQPLGLPAIFALVTVICSLALYAALEKKQDKDILRAVKAGAEGARGEIAVRMESRFRSIARMAKAWELSGAPAQAGWDTIASTYVRDLPDAAALEWVDAAHQLRWISPRAAAQVNGGDPLSQARREKALATAATRQKPAVTQLIRLPGGVPGFVIYAPIVVNGKVEGFLGAVFRAENSLERFLPRALAQGQAMTVSEGDQVFFQRDASAPPARAEWVVNRNIGLNGASWNLRMWPGAQLAGRIDSPLPLVVLTAGSISGLLLGALCAFARRSSRQAEETARMNFALRTALEQVKTLEDLFPICCGCKRVRDDSGYWTQIDTYLRRHTNASLTHGYCPECLVKFYEECGIDIPEKARADLAAGNFD